MQDIIEYFIYLKPGPGVETEDPKRPIVETCETGSSALPPETGSIQVIPLMANARTQATADTNPPRIDRGPDTRIPCPNLTPKNWASLVDR